MNLTYLSLGTNMGNKLKNLHYAIKKINLTGNICAYSSIYQAPAWGFEGHDFYNMSICLKTKLNADDLLDKLLLIEKDLGRKRNPNVNGYQSRCLDLDILFFNDEIINTKKITVPHPKLQDRKFVLIPTLEIAPNFKHPTFNKTLEQLLKECIDISKLKLTKHQIKA